MSRSPFIVIEGPDGTGKTTLAEHLSRSLSLPIDHFGAPDMEAFDFYNYLFEKYPNGGAIVDRYHVGSFVYGNVFRNGNDLSDYESWLLEGKLLSYNSILIYAKLQDPSISTKIIKLRSSKDEYEAVNKQGDVLSLYDKYISSYLNLPYLIYDFSEENALEDISNELLQVLTYFNNCIKPVDNYNPFGNQYSPEIAIFGERPTRYMFNILRAAKLPPNKVCLVNTVPSRFDLSVDWLDTQIVASGNDIERKLLDLNVKPHRTILPSEVVSKKYYSQITRYANAIKGLERWDREST